MTTCFENSTSYKRVGYVRRLLSCSVRFMSMTQNAVIVLLFFLSFFSCSEINNQIGITEEALEGYWVSGYLLHNTEMSRSIASENSKKPKVQLLRLKNTVNGFADTSYRINGNVLSYRIALPNLVSSEHIGRMGEAFYPFLITFFSRDRLILKDPKTLEETTFYNINIIPASGENFTEIKFGFDILINDSFTFRKTKFYSYKLVNDSAVLQEENYYPNQKIMEKWKNELNILVRRINWDATLFLTGSNNPEVVKSGEHTMIMPQGPGVQLDITTVKHAGEWKFRSQYISEPALSALVTEMRVFQNYCYYNDLLPTYHYCGASTQ